MTRKIIPVAVNGRVTTTSLKNQSREQVGIWLQRVRAVSGAKVCGVSDWIFLFGQTNYFSFEGSFVSQDHSHQGAVHPGQLDPFHPLLDYLPLFLDHCFRQEEGRKRLLMGLQLLKGVVNRFPKLLLL